MGSACGSYDGSCGGSIECTSGCTCDASSFLTDCPSRPCESVTGCDAGTCVYAPVRCGDAECACLSGSCDDDALRSCGDSVCAPSYCDPAPVLEGGELRYQNTCVAPEEVRCGSCGLGLFSCDATAGLACDDIIEDPAALRLDPAAFECDSSLPESTFVFVDPAYAGADSDGSRSAPFVTPEAGGSAAAARAAHGIVIAGSPTIANPPPLVEGVSI